MTLRILLRCSENDLDLNESFYIEKLDTVYPRGYNLRCGSMAAMPATANALSTFVYVPTEYENAEDEQDVKSAVNAAVQDVLGTNLKPWAGVIQMSVSDLNAIRGAIQHTPWAGPVKGRPVPAHPAAAPPPFTCQSFPPLMEISSDEMKDYSDEMKDCVLKAQKSVLNHQAEHKKGMLDDIRLCHKIKHARELGDADLERDLKRRFVEA